MNGVAVPDTSIANLLVDLPVWGPDADGRQVNLRPQDGEPYIRALQSHFSGYLELRLVGAAGSRPRRRAGRERPLAGAQSESPDR